MNYLKKINEINKEESYEMWKFHIFTSHFLYETDKSSNVIYKLAQHIYSFFYQSIEDYDNNISEPLDSNQVLFTGWAFNEDAENPDEQFYETSPDDETHQRIYMSVFENGGYIVSEYIGSLKRTGRFAGKCAPDDIARTYKVGNKIIISINKDFIFTKNKHFSCHIWLSQGIKHEIEHLYHSAVFLHLSKQDEMKLKYDDEIKEFEHIFQEIDRDLNPSVRSILYYFDPERLENGLERLDAFLRKLVNLKEKVATIRQKVSDYIYEYFDGRSWPINKTSILGALILTSEIQEIVKTNIMNILFDDFRLYSYDDKFWPAVRAYVSGYHLYQNNNLYIIDLENHLKIEPSVISEFFTKDNYITLLKDKSVDNMKYVQNISHFLYAPRDTFEHMFYQYWKRAFDVIDKHIYLIYEVDESADEEMFGVIVFERDFGYSKESIENLRDIYEESNYYWLNMDNPEVVF